ncbi:MAG: YlbF family regulator [Eubacterium sp.]|nr:YlbF family regulator [Eubacterium sp.]
MANLETKTNSLIAAMKQSRIYQEYLLAEKELSTVPLLQRQVDDYRSEVLKIQSSGQDTYDSLDQIRGRYSQLFKNPLAMRYLDAENAVCRMVSRTISMIAEEVDVRLPGQLCR